MADWTVDLMADELVAAKVVLKACRSVGPMVVMLVSQLAVKSVH